jgi:simple sugar transport system permease protein
MTERTDPPAPSNEDGIGTAEPDAETRTGQRSVETVTAAPPAEDPAPPGGRWYETLVLPGLAVITGLAIGALLIIFTNDDALYAWARFFRHPGVALSTSWTVIREAYFALFTGAFGNPSTLGRAIASGELSQIQSALSPISETLVTATPLIFVGLSVSLGFRAGLFNIGAEGQMNMGALVASAAGFSFTWIPGPLHLVVVLVAGLVGGAAWGAIPGFLKAKTGAHEVITTIMLNFIAVSLVLYMLGTSFYQQQAEPIAKPVVVAFPHLFGASLRIHLGFVLAIGVAAATGWLLNRTTYGFEFRAVGANPAAARAAGMHPGRTTIVVFALAGGLAGLAGATQLASVTPSLLPAFAGGLGFDGIAIALLARARPAGVVVAAFLFGALRAGGRSMQAITQVPIEIIFVIQACVIAFVAAPALVRAIYRIKDKRPVTTEAFTKGWGG